MTGRRFTDEKAASLSLYSTCGRAVMALPAPLPHREGADAPTNAAAPVLARGCRQDRAGRCREHAQPGSAARTPEVHLIRQGADALVRQGREHEQCQRDLSEGPVTSAAPPAVSRAAGANKNAGAPLHTAARMTHRGEVDECSES